MKIVQKLILLSDDNKMTLNIGNPIDLKMLRKLAGLLEKEENRKN